MFTQTEIAEAAGSLVGEPIGRRYKARLITGDTLGSTGYYPAETLLRDGPKVFKKGTPMYLNHQTAQEKSDRPHGSIEQFAGELAEDAYYDGDGLYAEIEVFEHQIPLIKSLKDKIGISIRARGMTVIEEINGKSVPVFKELLLARSADFVVKAGAGGRLMQIIESALEQDSEVDSDNIEESEENMKEVLEAIESLRADFDTRLKVIEGSTQVEAIEAKVEVVKEVDYAAVLEIAEALSVSSLDSDGKARVLELHAANKKPVKELIEAEEAYVKKNLKSEEEQGGDEQEAEESAKVEKTTTKIALPSAWTKKETK